MRSEPVWKYACEQPVAASINRMKRGILSGRSEFVSPPDLCSTTPGTPKELRTCGRLLLLTFLGEARKVSGCRAAPGRSSEERKDSDRRDDQSEQPHPTLSSLATLKSNNFIPNFPKLICARVLPPPPSILTITPSPNLACATFWPMRQPESGRLKFCAILLLPDSGASSQADLGRANQFCCCCTLGDSHLMASSGNSSKKRERML